MIIFVYVTANPTRDLSDNVNIPLKINWETKENEEEKNVSRDKENVLKRDSEDKNNERNKQNFGDVKKRIKRRKYFEVFVENEMLLKWVGSLEKFPEERVVKQIGYRWEEELREDPTRFIWTLSR